MAPRPPETALRPRFWERFPLEALTPAEWEALCDRCALCCLHKLETAAGEVVYTQVACARLDLASGRCRDYPRRHEVAGCVALTPALARTLAWLPPTCAYRRLARGEPLPPWHPLV
ncbi:MAG: YcgN family cysteine cluster protein, partial [Nitrospirae bacterium]